MNQAVQFFPVTCPNCGRRIVDITAPSAVRLTCPRCRNRVIVKVEQKA